MSARTFTDRFVAIPHEKRGRIAERMVIFLDELTRPEYQIEKSLELRLNMALDSALKVTETEARS